MRFKDDGDIIRALGYVCLYSAYLEEGIQTILKILIDTGFIEDRRGRRLEAPSSKQVEMIKAAAMEKLQPLGTELVHLPDLLDAVLEMFDDRNTFIHGRVYATEQGDVRKSGRDGAVDEPANSSELYDLVNRIEAAMSAINAAHMFQLPRLINSLQAPPPVHEKA